MADLDCILRIPPTSPSRRDYGIRSPARSPSPVRLDDPSRPQSPWRQAPATSSREVEAFRLYESNPPSLVLDRSTYYSGPLPVTVTERSSLPSYSGPLPGFAIATVTESFEFATWARIYHQHANDSNLSPEVGLGSSEDSSFREYRAKEDSSTSTFYLAAASPAAASPATEFSARAGMHGRVGSVSGELGRSEDQKSNVARGYKSGEITGLDFGADDAVRQQRWESLNKPDTSSNCDITEPMVTIPFKWEGESKKSPSRASSTTSKSVPISASVHDFSFGSSHTKSSVETASVQGSEVSEAVSVASKPVKAVPSKPKKQSPTVHSAVPFKWEDAPGKPKVEEKASTQTKTPALQLPPRLAAVSVKRGSWSTSTPSTTRSRNRSSSNTLRSRPNKTQTQSSPDSTSSKYSRRSQPVLKSKSPSPQSSVKPSPQPASPLPQLASPSPQPTSPLRQSTSPSPQDADEPRHTLGPNFLSGPLDNSAKPVASVASKSGPISQLGFPQHDFFSVRSPTSTLQGPGSSISSSQPSSCKSPSVTYSHSGTSAESLEHWSDPDHSGHGHESSEPETTTARKRLPSKPPMSPITHSPATSALSDFDKTPVAAEEEPPTRLPYKMPETNMCQDIVVAKPASRRSSSRCFDLPKFRSKSSQGHVEMYAPSSSLEHGYRSPTYKATLDLLSPSPSPTPATSKARSVKLGSASPRRFVEGLCNSLKHSLHKISKRSGGKSKTIVQDDLFMKRHPSLVI